MDKTTAEFLILIFGGLGFVFLAFGIIFKQNSKETLNEQKNDNTTKRNR